MSYLSNLSWESSPWCRLGILAPFRLRQVQEVRLRSKPCATSTIRVGTLTLRQEREMAAGCGTPIRGPWAGLETCELPPVEGGERCGRALAALGRGPSRCEPRCATRGGRGPRPPWPVRRLCRAGTASPGRGTRPRRRGRDGHERSSGAAGSEASGRHSGGIRPPYPGRRL